MSIRIGNASGFWGDDLPALRRQLEGGGLDYLTADYLSEIAMGILAKQQRRDPERGYVADFLRQMEEVMDRVVASGVRVIVNAGGRNPLGLARRLRGKVGVASIEGDDVTATIASRVICAHAYTGVPAVVAALKAGAQVVVAGRVADPSLTLAAAVHAFGWALDDWDRLAAGTVAGHLIECGAQVCGGNFTDWKQVKSWANMGFPLVEMEADGSFVVTKHPGTGGFVTVDTVKEQLLYEIGDPRAYISPDVIVDFTTVRVEEAGPDRVRVSGVKGRPATETFKVSVAYDDGHRATGSIIVSGPDARAKAEVFKRMFWEKVGTGFEAIRTEFVGWDGCFDRPSGDPPELLVRFSARDRDPARLRPFAEAISALILSGPPGVAVTGGRPSSQEVVSYRPAFVGKDRVVSTVRVLRPDGTEEAPMNVPSVTGFERPFTPLPPEPVVDHPAVRGASVRLMDLCLARSGDKGDSSNIGVIARSPGIYTVLDRRLTAARVKEIFSGMCEGTVTRHRLPNLNAFNFVLEEALGGGGMTSLRIDPQGKTFAQTLLTHFIELDGRDRADSSA